MIEKNDISVGVVPSIVLPRRKSLQGLLGLVQGVETDLHPRRAKRVCVEVVARYYAEIWTTTLESPEEIRVFVGISVCNVPI